MITEQICQKEKQHLIMTGWLNRDLLTGLLCLPHLMKKHTVHCVNGHSLLVMGIRLSVVWHSDGEKDSDLAKASAC